MAMTLRELYSLKRRDWENGAVQDEIAAVFIERDQLKEALKKSKIEVSSGDECAR